MKKKAQSYVDCGYIVIPCNRRTKVPLKREWPKTKLDKCINSITDINNIGLLTGERNNITVIDIDVKDKGLETWNILIEKYQPIDTPTVRTGSGGLHLYCKYTPNLKSDSKVIIFNDQHVGIDIKNNGGYVIAPPSIHDNGNAYCWEKPLTEQLCEIPQWFFEHMKNKDAVRHNPHKGPTICLLDNIPTKSKIKIKNKETRIECYRINDKCHIKKLLVNRFLWSTMI